MRLREVIIPEKEVIIRVKNEISRRRTEVIISSIWTADLFPDGPRDVANEKKACFGGSVLGLPHTGHLTRDRFVTCDRSDEEENALIYKGDIEVTLHGRPHSGAGKIRDHFAGFVQHRVNNPVFPYPDPVQRFRTGQFDRIVRERICFKDFPRAQKYSGAGLLGFSGNLSSRCF